MKTCILTTTINIPTLLRDYALNARDHGHGDIEFIVIGDRKTPAGGGGFLRANGAGVRMPAFLFRCRAPAGLSGTVSANRPAGAVEFHPAAQCRPAVCPGKRL